MRFIPIQLDTLFLGGCSDCGRSVLLRLFLLVRSGVKTLFGQFGHRILGHGKVLHVVDLEVGVEMQGRRELDHRRKALLAVGPRILQFIIFLDRRRL